MRKILHIFLSLVIVYAGTVSAFANTSIGGWTAVDALIAGANTTINATKTAGGKVLTSAITIAPQAGKVGKYLLRGGAVGALALAVPQLLGEGIDWVLDPANNRVRYTTVEMDLNGICSNSAGIKKPASEFVSACAAGYGSCSLLPLSGGSFAVKTPSNSTYMTLSCSGVQVPVEKYLPIDTVAAKVISNAEAGHGPSQEAVKAVALEGFAAGEHDAALEAAAEEVSTDNPTDPNNPADPADPAAPFDPSSIIEVIKSLKALLAGILSSITELTGFFNSDAPPEKTQKETDVPVEAPPELKNATEFDVNYIGFSSQCPTLSPFSVGIGAVSSSMTFDMMPLCNLAVTIRPAIIAIAYFIGLGVVASAIRET